MATGNIASNLMNGGPMVGPVGSDELAEGLLLMQASAIKVVRLQLAMERRDQRVALQAVDDLVEIDGRLQEFLSKLPAGADLDPLARELDVQRSALAEEKLTLAAGISRPAPIDRAPVWADERQAPTYSAALPDVTAEAFDAEDYGSARAWPVAIALVVLLLAIAGAAYALGYRVDIDALTTRFTGG